MVRFTSEDDLEGAQFVEVSMRGARFVEADLSGVVMRGVDVRSVDIDAPWLCSGATSFLINGVDVAPLVDAELNRRFPGRANRYSADPEGLRAAWADLQRAWHGALDRAEGMPTGTVDESVDGEWSFAQTLRHLVLATDAWLGRAILGVDQPFHPLGQPFEGAESTGLDTSIFVTGTPAYAEVLQARADRVGMVSSFLGSVTADDLAVPRQNPWNREEPETTLSCLHVILEEEWEHLRFAGRDLDTLVARST